MPKVTQGSAPAPAGQPPGETTGEFAGYLVAVGASAGGLDALERFFEGLPPHTDVAYVVIQHLSPDHKSMMGNLLGRHTRMPVVTVEDGMAIAAGRVHLIPPGSIMRAAGGRLWLTPKDPRVLTLPIDLFFTSLAKELGNRAVGVILSGTGSDGTRGALAINEAGGLLLAQDPETAKFDGMPRSVIATGLVDAILAPEALGLRVLDHTREAPRTPIRHERLVADRDKGSALEEIQHLLRHVAGIDFRDYKPATVLRRIERRLQVRHIPDHESYAQLLDGDRAELATLHRELLIPVTSFFRDPESFEVLAEAAIEVLVKERQANQPLRIWVPGVSTGEEAYSLAILFTEACERVRRWPGFKVFATDVAQQSLDTASAGVFSEAITSEIAPERLERFFVPRGNHFVIRPEVRQNIIFARHNLLEDPPFTRMDLVSCRNVLIYFEPEAQERVLRRLQYALAPGGFLFLGSSESLGALQGDFTPVSTKHKIHRVLRHVALPLDQASAGHSRLPATGRRHRAGPSTTRAGDAAVIDAGLTTLLRSYAPASLLLSRRHELLHVFGDVSRFLRIGEGSATLDLAKLLPQRLAPVALALLHRAAKGAAPLRSDVLGLPCAEGPPLRLRLVARPVEVPQGEPHLILSFEPEPPIAEPALPAGIETLDLDRENAARLQTLEQELAATRESLQATIEELETANEELQATNEELMASNEELQSSNEELQSVNEELYTVNAENQEKIEILNQLNADLDSLARAVSIATVFVDGGLRITRFTPEATTLFNIRDGDIGRPIGDITNRLDHPELVAELRHTIEDGHLFEREIHASNGATYLARILPYAVRARGPRGAVATFVDVTSLHDRDRLQATLDALPAGVALLDAAGRIQMVNARWRALAREGGDPDLHRSGPGIGIEDACAILPGGESLAAARDGIARVLGGETAAFRREYIHDGPREAGRWRLLYAAPLGGRGGGAVVSHCDLTAQVAADA
ncbi:chemotaxis protein CheB [Thiococcus pfennigii]|uniref:chemotaxis protein CheB n=1 Tax=Thiococcus pfennigii TaxID=1057 RepID=UPI001902C433|nr:chemotaxis protein CheB [Thiococcus pfennigii]MBK1731008.1 chemotaxis protein CheR [Thiococcus pfennigii]